MRIKVRIKNESETWNENPFVEIEMPSAPQLGQQLFLGDKLVEELIAKAQPFFKKWHMGMPCVWDCTYVVAVLWSVREQCYSVALSDKPF